MCVRVWGVWPGRGGSSRRTARLQASPCMPDTWLPCKHASMHASANEDAAGDPAQPGPQHARAQRNAPPYEPLCSLHSSADRQSGSLRPASA
eukprot:350709-Chlamydomonas_euryale.AAC.5